MGSPSTPSYEPARDERLAPKPAVDAGRLGVYAALGASTGAVPLPWLPDWLAARVRGALVHDIAVRRGVALSADARAALSDALSLDAPRGLAVNALRVVGATIAVRTLTRLGPAAMLWPLSGALRSTPSADCSIGISRSTAAPPAVASSWPRRVACAARSTPR